MRPLSVPSGGESGHRTAVSSSFFNHSFFARGKKLHEITLAAKRSVFLFQCHKNPWLNITNLTLRVVKKNELRAVGLNMALLRPAGLPMAGRGRRGDPARAGLPAVGEPPPSFRPSLGGPRSPAATASAHLPDDAVDAFQPALTAAELALCEDKFGLLSKQFHDSDQISEGEAVAMLQASGFSAKACAEILHEALTVAASPHQCTTSTMPTPISLFAESDECGASGAHCASPNDTALSVMSSPLLPCSANTPANTMPPR